MSGISLLKKFYPQYSSVKVDEEKFLRLAYEELLRIRPNPLIDARDEALFDRYVESMDAAGRSLAARVRREVTARGKRSVPRTRGEIIRALTPNSLKAGVERLLTSLDLYRRTASVIRLPGAKHCFNDAFDLFSNWERLVLEHDLVSLANMTEAFQENLLLSAHKLEADV